MGRTAVGLGFVLLVTLGITISPASAQPPSITWLTLDFAPFYIHEGTHRGEGIGDRVTRLIQRRMTEWIHVNERAELAEVNRRLRMSHQICTAAYLHTQEREEVMLYSIPSLVLPPNGITIRRGDQDRFGAGPVSLEELLEREDLRLGIARGRSYGEAIDAALESHRGSPHVYSRIGDDIYRSLFAMLSKGGVDYIIGYPYEAVFRATELGMEDEILNLPLLESSDHILAYIVCPRSEWGHRVIGELNQVLEEVRPTDEYRSAIERWLDPATVEEFRRRYSAALQER